MDLDGDLEDGLERLAKYYIDENNSTAAAFDAICLDCDHWSNYINKTLYENYWIFILKFIFIIMII